MIEHSVLAQVVAEATNPGAEMPPTALLERVGTLKDPLAAASNNDEVGYWFEAVRTQFGNPNLVRVASAEQIARWAALLRWAHRALHEWRSEADPHDHEFVSILVITHYFSFDPGFWSKMPTGVQANRDLMNVLARRVGGMTAVFQAPADAPIWEREAVDAFQRAEERNDWHALLLGIRRFERMSLSSFLQREMVRCLHRYDATLLAQATGPIRSMMIAVQLATCLATAGRLKLALDTTNSRIRFAVLYVTLIAQRDAAAETILLTQLLVAIAREATLWEGCMTAFNRAPLPSLMEPLGRALSTIPDGAIPAYIDSIDLKHGNSESRALVADCLRTFAEIASPMRRQLLWTVAFRRWSTWNFDVADADRHLAKITHSPLDYAIVGYALEVKTSDDLDGLVSGYYARLKAVEYEWHASSSDMCSARLRLVSSIQPFLHARHLRTAPQDWLAKVFYQPVDNRGEDYVGLMFREM